MNTHGAGIVVLRYFGIGTRRRRLPESREVVGRRGDLPGDEIVEVVVVVAVKVTAQAFHPAAVSRRQRHRHARGCVHYIRTLVQRVSAIVSRQRLRSAQQNTLVVPRYRLTTYGRRAFPVAGPTAWNSLPVAFRDPTISDACFRRHLTASAP